MSAYQTFCYTFKWYFSGSLTLGVLYSNYSHCYYSHINMACECLKMCNVLFFTAAAVELETAVILILEVAGSETERN